MPAAPEKLLLAAPRGYCAGVDRAVQTVERALELHGAPVYVRKEIVHNKHVVEELRERGAIFVDELSDAIPEGAVTVFSAHGVSPAVHADAQERGLRTIDATCPLVTKVHREAVKFAQDGYTIVLVGHAGHEEVEGTMGEVPGSIVLVESEADADALEVEDPSRIAYLTQTTLSVDETAAIIGRLRERFPAITGPRTDDICYATTNRQLAVRQMAGQCDLVLVIGSRNSSNSNRLVDVARDHGAASYLIDNETEVQEEWLEGVRVVGISSGASAPEELVERLVGFFRDRGTEDISEFEVLREDVRFMLPKVIRQRGRLEPLPQLVPVLVELGRRAADRRALAVQAQRRRRQRHPPDLAHRLHPERLGERVGLGHVVDRARRHGGRPERLDPLCRRTRPQDRLEPRRQARPRARRARCSWRSARRPAAPAARRPRTGARTAGRCRRRPRSGGRRPRTSRRA